MLRVCYYLNFWVIIKGQQKLKYIATIEKKNYSTCPQGSCKNIERIINNKTQGYMEMGSEPKELLM